MNNTSKNQPLNKTNCLHLETLEERMMLSAVEIFAAGGTGQESFQLKVDDVVVATFDNVGGDASARQFERFVWATDDRILSADQIRVEFINDEFDPDTGFDRNLFVDKIRLDGVTFETENPSTFGTGIYTEAGFSGPGFLETETLNVNGSFFYSSEGATPIDPGTRIRVDARGTTGDEIIQIQIDGNTVAEFDLSTDTEIYLHKTSELVSPDRVRVVFTNDLYDPENDIDRNVIVHSVQLIDLQSAFRQRLFPTDSTTFSNGTYAEDGLNDGFGRGDTLHVDGYFQFGATQNTTEVEEDEVPVAARSVFVSTPEASSELTDIVDAGANVGPIGNELEENQL